MDGAISRLPPALRLPRPPYDALTWSHSTGIVRPVNRSWCRGLDGRRRARPVNWRWRHRARIQCRFAHGWGGPGGLLLPGRLVAIDNGATSCRTGQVCAGGNRAHGRQGLSGGLPGGGSANPRPDDVGLIWGHPQRKRRIARDERAGFPEDFRKQAGFQKPCQDRIPPSPPTIDSLFSITSGLRTWA